MGCPWRISRRAWGGARERSRCCSCALSRTCAADWVRRRAMQDDARADLLFRILAGEDLLQDHPDDAELRALAELGSRLDTLRPTIAALDRAEQAFNPIFA